MKTSITTIATAISLAASGIFAVAQAQDTTQIHQQREQSSIVSEQVRSDLADWRKAGFDDYSYDVLSYNVFGAEYKKRYAKYQDLRKLHAHQSTQN